MAFTATDVRVKPRPFGLTAVRTYAYLLFAKGQFACQPGGEHHVWASVCQLDARYRAGKTEVTLPIKGRCRST